MRVIFIGVFALLSKIVWCQEEPKLVLPIGHTDIVNSGQFCLDNKHIVTTSHDNTIKIWEKKTGKIIHTLVGHTDLIWSVKISPDNKLLASHSRDLTTIVWNFATGNQVYKLKNQINPEFHPSENILITSSDTTINFLDLNSGKISKSIKGNGKNSISISATGQTFLTISDEVPQVPPIVWDFKSTSPLFEIPTRGRVQSGSFNGNGTKIIITEKYSVTILNSNSGVQLKQYTIDPTNKKYQEEFQSGIISPDGDFLIATHIYQNPTIWNINTGKFICSLSGHVNLIRSAEFSLDGTMVLTTSFDNTIKLWETSTGKLVRSIDSPIRGITHFAKFSADNKFILASCGDTSLEAEREYGIYIWDLLNGTLVLTLNGSNNNIKSVTLSSDERLILTSSENSAKIWESSTGKIFRTFEDQNNKVTYSTFSADGRYVVMGSEDQTVKIWEVTSGRLLKTLTGHSERIFNIQFSPDNRFLLTSDYLNSIVWEFPSGKFLYTLKGHSRSKGLKFVRDALETYQPHFSWDGKYISTSSDNEVIIWETQTGKKLSTLSGHKNLIRTTDFSPDGEYVATTARDGTVKIWSTTTGQLKRSIYLSFNWPESAKFSSSGKYLITGFETFSINWNVNTGDSIYRVVGTSPIFSADGQSIITTSADGTLRVYNAISGKIESLKTVLGSVLEINSTLTKALTLKNSQLYITDLQSGLELLSWIDIVSDYVITHPSGLFDASPGAMEKLYFVQGLDIIDFNQLKERYYEPGLWKKVMAGEPLRNVVGMKSIDLPPDIKVGQVDTEGYLQIQLTNRGGGIGEINLFINGKEVIKDARDANVKPDAATAALNIFVGKHKSIIKGQENLIAVKAWNKDHWVVSRGQVVSYHSKEIEQYKPAVHILTCGVSDYTGSLIDLKYAAKDANDVSIALQLGAKKLFGAERSYVYNLTTSQTKEFYPTKVNIIRAFEKISNTAHPLDIFVMYVSGHGINYGGQDGDWHYLTQEAYTGSASAYNDPAIRTQTTISSNELVELFKKVPALKQVLMLDACASGKVVDNLMAQKDIESTTLRALDRMRDRTGMHIITGCTADAVSYEASQYGQGVLTYSLLEGIRGAALRENQYVDVNKLFQYAQDRVPQLAEGIGGIQTPQVFSPQGSQSFDIGILSDVEKKAIPIAKIRPVYIRSNFQDENELEDILDLSKAVDESLNEASAKGIEASLIFVDVRDYPDGCRLIGRYKKEGNSIVLKLRKKCGGDDKTFELKANDVNSLKAEVLKVL